MKQKKVKKKIEKSADYMEEERERKRLAFFAEN